MNRKTGEFVYYIIGLFMFVLGFFVKLDIPDELPERKPIVSEFREYYVSGATGSSVASLSPSASVSPSAEPGQ